MDRFDTATAAETEAAGASLARRLEPGDVVLVAGELGSGKTTFVRGACRALRVCDPVTSPTFTIGQLYRVSTASDARARARGLVEVAHLDLYRLSSLSGEDLALLGDYLTPERVGFVEWPALAEPELDAEGHGIRLAARVRIGHAGEHDRTIELEYERRP